MSRPGTRLPDAELYALVHRGTPGDLEFYLREAAGTERLLELGCGAGRILIPLIQAGHRVTGLDADEGALELAMHGLRALAPTVRERATLVHADMCGFQLDGLFERIYIPFNTIYCLDSEQSRVECLSSARAHLAPGGKIIFDAYAIDGFHHHNDPVAVEEAADDDEPVVSVQWHGGIHDVYEATRWDRDAQRLEVRYRYVPRNGGVSMEETVHHHYLLTGQVAALCERAGLELLAAHGDFLGTTLSPHSEHMVCITSAR